MVLGAGQSAELQRGVKSARGRLGGAVRRLAAGAVVAGGVALGGATPEVVATAAAAGCPPGMANVLGRYCIDRYEASVDVVDAQGRTVRRHSPYHAPEPGQSLRARSRAGVVPQAHISQTAAAAACAAAGKRLCTDAEWVTACKGRQPTRFPYGEEREPGRCHDAGVSPLRRLHGSDDSVATFGFEAMNDPRLNQVPGSVARTGAFARCRNSFGVFDMVGNLHEWTAASSGTFRGGYYLDTQLNGDGCDYQTTAHSTAYRDYSIGFRCCRGLEGSTGVTPPRVASVGSPTQAGTTAPRRTHVVTRGETLSGIAVNHGVTVSVLCAANGLDRQRPIRPGQELHIPASATRGGG